MGNCFVRFSRNRHIVSGVVSAKPIVITAVLNLKMARSLSAIAYNAINVMKLMKDVYVIVHSDVRKKGEI